MDHSSHKTTQANTTVTGVNCTPEESESEMVFKQLILYS